VAELKDLDGFDQRVIDYATKKREARKFLRDFQKLLDYIVPLYAKEGKAFLTLAIGCTGGRHRSVAVAELISQHLREAGYPVFTRHRDVERG